MRPLVTGSKRDLAYDVAAVLIALPLGLGIATDLVEALSPAGRAFAFAFLTAGALALLARRRTPVAVAWLTVAVAAAAVVLAQASPGTLEHADLQNVVWWPPAGPLAAYAVLRYAPRRAAAWPPVAALVVVNVVAGDALPDVGGPSEQDNPGALAFRGVAVTIVAALLGLYAGARRRVLQGLVERAERAERERHLLAEQARAEERARLAAEMHDVVAHRVTLMVLQAGALRIRAPDEDTRRSAEELRSAGCTALDELRDVIGLLRRSAEGADDQEPAAATAPDLSSLIAESESVGVPVELVEEGDPPLASPVVGRTVHRIVQEALTNVRKHAPGASVRVHVRYRADGVGLTVTNTAAARAADPQLAGSGSGSGLEGLRQRVELIAGTLRSGPAGDGGFAVEASLPAFVPTAEPVP